MPHARKNHGHAEPVRCGDHFCVAHRASRLNHGGSARLAGLFYPIGERKKSVGGDDASRQGKLRFHDRNFHRIHAAHLPCAHSNRLPGARENDGVGLHMLADFPAEEHRLNFFPRRRAARDYFQLALR